MTISFEANLFSVSDFLGLGIGKSHCMLDLVNMENEGLTRSTIHSILTQRCGMNDPVRYRAGEAPNDIGSTSILHRLWSINRRSTAP